MIRQYTTQPLARETIEQLLQAAVVAPSPHNRQPWRFAVVQGSAKARLASAMGAQLRHDLAADGAPLDVIERDALRSYTRITTAQAGVLACLTMQDMDVYSDARRNEAEHWMAGQAVAAALQNLLARAAEMGVGACWMCAPLFCGEAVQTALGLPSQWQPQALITLGYPADEGKPRGRKPIDAVSMWLE